MLTFLKKDYKKYHSIYPNPIKTTFPLLKNECLEESEKNFSYLLKERKNDWINGKFNVTKNLGTQISYNNDGGSYGSNNMKIVLLLGFGFGVIAGFYLHKI